MQFSSEDLLRLHNVSGIGGRTLRKILTWAVAESLPLSDVFALDVDTLKVNFGLRPPICEALRVSSADSAAELAEKLANSDVKLVTAFDAGSGYPAQMHQRLAENAPPLLYVKGDVRLLSLPGIAFSGSRHTSEQGIHHTRSLAADAVKANLTVISGHAPGTDAAAHQTALLNKGVTVLVLPEGMLRFRLRPELREGYDQYPENVVAVSEFSPNVPWSAQNAMIRNLTILGLARVLCVIEAGEEGGTRDAGERALKLEMPVFVLDYPDPPSSAAGNRKLIEQGAQPIPVTPRPTLPPFSDNIQPNKPPDPPQLKLF